MRLLLRVLTAALLLALVPHPACAASRWTSLRSDHFLLIGNAPEKQIRRTGQRLEQFREVMLRVLPGARASSPVPVVVVVFDGDRAFEPYKPLFKGRTVAVAGYFAGGDDVAYIAVTADARQDSFETIFHEYAHFLTQNSVGRLPTWVNEGVAQVYQTYDERDGGKTALIGLATNRDLDTLQTSQLLSIDELLAVDEDSPIYNEQERQGIFYAQSWALAHYLMLGDQARTQQWRSYLTRVTSGVDSVTAFHEVFGTDTAPLEKALKAYARQLQFPAMKLRFPEAIATTISAPATAMAPAEADAYLADLLARTDRVDQARTALNRILAASPNQARALAVLGTLEFHASHADLAIPLLRRAAAAAPEDSYIQMAFGRALVGGPGGGAAASTALLQEARTALTRATTLDPALVHAQALLGFVELAEGGDLAKPIALLEAAVKAAPAREQYRMILAQALMSDRQFDRATAVLGPILASSPQPESRNAARALLAQVAGMRAQSPPPGARADRSRLAGIAPPKERAPGLGPSGPPTIIPDLRPVGAGEIRVLGRLRSIECRQGSVVLLVDTDAGPLRLTAPGFQQVTFLTYRQELPGSIACGAQIVPRVLATFRRPEGAVPTPGSDGIAVAIELLPDGYVPTRAPQQRRGR